MASFSSLLGSYGPWITPKPLAHLRSQPFCALPSDSTKRFQVIKKKKQMRITLWFSRTDTTVPGEKLTS